MLNDEQLAHALRSAMPHVDATAPPRDLWAQVIERTRQAPSWSLADWSAAALVVIALLIFPKWFWFLAYHL